MYRDPTSACTCPVAPRRRAPRHRRSDMGTYSLKDFFSLTESLRRGPAVPRPSSKHPRPPLRVLTFPHAPPPSFSEQIRRIWKVRPSPATVGSWQKSSPEEKNVWGASPEVLRLDSTAASFLVRQDFLDESMTYRRLWFGRTQWEPIQANRPPRRGCHTGTLYRIGFPKPWSPM